MEDLINRIRTARSMGLTREDIIAHFVADFSQADIFLAYVAVTVLEG